MDQGSGLPEYMEVNKVSQWTKVVAYLPEYMEVNKVHTTILLVVYWRCNLYVRYVCCIIGCVDQASEKYAMFTCV